MKRSAVALFAVIFLLSVITMLSPSISAITVEPGIRFSIGNENYTVAAPMVFSNITYEDPLWISFNTTDFNVSSAQNINISLSYLCDNMSVTTAGTILLSFTANATSGLTSFNISGFIPGGIYDVYRSGILYSTVTSTGSGNVLFANSAWSSRSFQIRYHTVIVTPTTGSTNIILNFLPLIVGFVFFAVLATMLLTDVLTKETLIAWLLAFIVAMVVIVTIVGL